MNAFAGKTGMRLSYPNEDLKTLRIKEVNCTNEEVSGCLTQLFRGLPVRWRTSGSLLSVQYTGGIYQQQSGRITGKIVDEAGNPVAGAEVRIGEKTITTDNNGDFSTDLPAGTYTLIVTMKGFRTLRVEDLAVKANETNSVSFVMSAAKNQVSEDGERTIKEVVIRGTRKADTQAGLLTQQKKAAQMSDGISAEQIAKTPDSDVGATLKRVTGVTTVDNKYVVVRSMGERWNTAAMDGVNLPSTDAYNQNFSFDIIPTAMVESVVVSKTATPDMNANFTGGYVEVKTKDIPNKDFLTVGMGTSFNSVSAFKEFLTKQRGKNDYWGYDTDGLRNYPKDLATTTWDSPNFHEQSKLFTQDNFTTYKTSADPGSNFQLAGGKSFNLGTNGNKFGFAGAVTMRHEENIFDIEHTSRSGWMHNIFIQKDGPMKQYDFKNMGHQYKYSSRLAGMLNFGLQLGKHRISSRNSYTHIFDNSLTRVTGWHEYARQGDLDNANAGYHYFYHGTTNSKAAPELPFVDENNYPVYQTLWQNKIEGNHKLGNVEVNWFGARSSVDSETKDYTRFEKMYRRVNHEILGYYVIYNPLNRQQHGNIENNTVSYNVGANVAFDINAENLKNRIKLGYFGTFSENTNKQQRAFLRVKENRPNPYPTKYTYYFPSFRELFASQDWQDGYVGWAVNNFFGGRYNGKIEMHTPFLMLDHRWDNWRFVWGARAENYTYTLLESQRENKNEGYTDEQIDDKKWEVLPSANLTFSPNTKSNIRVAYSRVAIRPQFQERTSIPYYDPIVAGVIQNAAGIKSSIADNYDLKYEWFPALGEILSLGVYHKVINDPIERTAFYTPEGNAELNVANSKKAVLTGVEAEVRKSLGFIASGFLERLYVSGNVTFNKTKVTAYISRFGNLLEDNKTYEADRPMFGQTPWAYNLGLSYEGDRLGLNLAYNAKGNQYVQVGYDYKQEEIMRPYSVLDAQISYKMLENKNFQFKLNIKNLLDTAQEFYNNWLSYQTPNPDATVGEDSVRDFYKLSPGATTKYDAGIDELTFRAKNGRQFSLSVEYTF
ncbi:TonB-dependent receptor [Chryseobacterium taklimakanense]|uniref:TonB-dependent receptor n=1 Tax=Chryseobacterium taklimakanense TaxID=536441 RepID=A0A3G8WKD3_9FLAO|nr:TonB-dependent receptor [Chryseobacterium taklimakanense]AZI20678.1 TonB-dependent receptor [Chryseobacterium taklimakanense]